MPLNPVTPGLKRIKLSLNGVSAAKVSLSVPVGDELDVSEDVANQLRSQDAGFQTADEMKRPKGGPAPEKDEKPAPKKSTAKKS